MMQADRKSWAMTASVLKKMKKETADLPADALKKIGLRN